jgi:phosphatidylinositol phospholipase C delta
MRKHAEDAKVLASFALTNASDKARAARQTLEYKEKKAKVAEISANLASLTFLHSSRLKYWKKSLALRCCHMHSVPEGKIRQIIRNQASRTQLIEFSKTHLLRTFPSPLMQKSRSSANFNPILPWSTGSQMVAMDHFACDDFLLVNDGFFRQNGSTGYVLKPDRLTRQGIEPSPKENEERWNFRVLSGYCLPKPELEGTRKGLTLASFGTVNPRVRITLFDGLVSGREKRPTTYTTRTVSRNGLNPVWNDTSGMSVVVSSPSTAVFLFSVWNHNDENGTDDFIAAASIPASCLREGYRSIPLFDSQHKRCGAYSFASLLVKGMKEL